MKGFFGSLFGWSLKGREESEWKGYRRFVGGGNSLLMNDFESR